MSEPGTINVAVAVGVLNNLVATDPESAHAEADSILLKCVDPAIRDAYQRLMARCDWWAHA